MNDDSGIAALDDLARDIDEASDADDEDRLRHLGTACAERLTSATGLDRVRVLYYWSNTFSSIIDIKRRIHGYSWDWNQPEAVENILLLRRALSEPSFEHADSVLSLQIRTNLANRLDAVGRPIAGFEQRRSVLRREPRFAKALAGQAKSVAFYARQLYDDGHIAVLLAHARSLFDAALDKSALWESGDRGLFASTLRTERDGIADALQRNGYDEDFDLNQWALGKTKRGRAYRRWCLRERLFLNPLNDGYTDSVAATDVLHLPSHTYRANEAPRFPAYFNLLKQEYVSARYRLYQAIHERDPRFVMRSVLLLDSGEEQLFGHYTENLRASFRSAYALFDKVALFVNDYFDVGMSPRDVTFRKVWQKKNSVTLRADFVERPNWPLRGLYSVSKDLFDSAFNDVADPDATSLAKLRNHLEHRFVSFQSLAVAEDTGAHHFVEIGIFERRALRLLKMAREALVYLSLAMHHEEALRRPHRDEEGITSGSQWLRGRLRGSRGDRLLCRPEADRVLRAK